MKPVTLMLCLALLAAACGDGTGPAPADLAGRWIVNESGTVVSLGIHCSHSGVLQLHQDGGDTAGDYDMRGQCLMFDQAADNARAGQIIRARVTGPELVFEHGECTYRGALGRDGTLQGKVTCSMRILGESHAYSGQWSAVRVPPPSLL